MVTVQTSHCEHLLTVHIFKKNKFSKCYLNGWIKWLTLTWFLHCPNFPTPRREMLQDLDDVLPKPTNNLKEINLMEFILYGTGNCIVDTNLLDAVRKYIAKSKRFT